MLTVSYILWVSSARACYCAFVPGRKISELNLVATDSRWEQLEAWWHWQPTFESLPVVATEGGTLKVAAVRDVLQLRFPNSGVERVFSGGALWLDSDAVVVDVAQPIDSLFVTRGGRSFLYAADPEPVRYSDFNAGVWLVRNTPGGREVMESWLAQFHPEQWTRGAEGKWSSYAPWAGLAYEQAFQFTP